MNLKETFAHNLRFFRLNLTDLGKSQAAGLMGVSRQTYSDWEKGEKMPSFDRLEDIARVLRVPTGALVMEGFGGKNGEK